MTTSVRERPAPALPAGADGGAPARRAMIRWAWRLFRREWRQQLLVLSLITVAVAGTVLGAAVASNTPPTPAAATFGTANHLVMFPGSQPHLAADIAAIRRRFGPVDVIENQSLVTGSASLVQLRAQNPVGPYGQPTLALVSGHYPHGPGQVALTSQVAALYNTHAGGIWRQGGTARRMVALQCTGDHALGQRRVEIPAGTLGHQDQRIALWAVMPAIDVPNLTATSVGRRDNDQGTTRRG